MKHIVDDVRIKEIKELSPPGHLLREFPATEPAAATTFEARAAIHRILHGADDRLLVVVGPCSIHDFEAALDYAAKLDADDVGIGVDPEVIGGKGLLYGPGRLNRRRRRANGGRKPPADLVGKGRP